MRAFVAVFVMLCYLLNIQPAMAAAMPVRVNNAISGSLDETLVKRGFAANDPRFGNTLVGVSNAVGTAAGTAAAVTVGAVTAPGWASLALAAGIGVIVTYAVTVGVNGLVNWLFGSNTIDESGNPLPVATTTSINAGGQFWKVSFASAGVNIQFAGGDGEAIARQGYYAYRSQTGQSTTTSPTCTVTSTMVTCSPIQATLQPSGAPGSCVAGTYWNYGTGQCTGYTFTLPSAIPTKTGASVQTAINDLPSSELNKPLSPAIIAAIVNRAWQQAAAQPGYSGLPYQAADPVTAEDVQPWLDANPTQAPTVQDFVSPNPSSAANPTPFAIPSSPTSSTSPTAAVPNANTVNPASAQPQANLGPDPGTSQPQLEATPTAEEILSPILKLMPDLASFQVPAHSSQCPVPEFDVWGSHFRMDTHCTLINGNQATIQAAFSLVWAILALFIILSA